MLVTGCLFMLTGVAIVIFHSETVPPNLWYWWGGMALILMGALQLFAYVVLKKDCKCRPVWWARRRF